MGLWHDGALMVAWGPSCHRHGERHGEIGLCKRYSRPHDGDDAHDDELRVLSRGCYELDQERLGNAKNGEPTGTGPTEETALEWGLHPSS